MKSLVVLVVLGAVLESGHGLKCIESICQSNAPNCQKGPQEKTCDPNDNCMTQTLEMTQQNIKMHMIQKGCVPKSLCNKASISMTCDKEKNQTGADKCDIKCCTGELCNSGDAAPKSNSTTPSTMLPPGGNTSLTCYVCDTGFPSNETSGGPSCDKPVEKKCGLGHDRCLTVKAKAKDPTTGEIVDIERRNCSTTMYNQCSKMCELFNSTGMAESCDVECCTGNKCNGDAPRSTTPAPPKAGQTESAMINMVAIVTGILVALYSN